jgi:hypothetical protein
MQRMNFFMPLLLTVVMVSALPENIAWGGNRSIVEKHVQELDRLNRKLLEQETKIPQNGHLELKAEARYGTDGEVDLRVYSRKFSAIAEEPIHFNGKQSPVPSN